MKNKGNKESMKKSEQKLETGFEASSFEQAWKCRKNTELVLKYHRKVINKSWIVLLIEFLKCLEGS